MARLRRLDKGRIAVLLVLVLGTVAVVTRNQWDWLFDESDPQTTSVDAPTIDDVDDATERLYRISPDAGSSLTYVVEESLAGKDGTATGTTTVLGGDIAINLEDPDASRIGQIVINVEMFESDSNLRDKRIRHDFLESTHYPFAIFDATEVSGIPAAIDDGTSSELTITGDLTIKEATHPVTFTGSATMNGDTLEASMSGTVLMSAYDIGPIHVAGLAHTEDEVAFTLELAAGRVETDAADPAEDLLVVAPGEIEVGEGSFSATVQPILEHGCVSCHTAGGPGWSTLELDVAADAARIADDIALVTQAGYMPPWPASDLSLDFEHDFSLSNDEIDAIAQWAADGGGLDVDPTEPLIPRGLPYEDVERDQVLPARGVYVGDLAVQDDYRCLIHEFDAGENGTWVTGIGFEPDADEVVHHSIVYKVPASARAEAEELDGQDGRPGWTCFGLSNMESDGVYSIGGWAPGQQPRVYPDGVGLFMEPGDFIVNQIHYHFDHETPPDQSVLVFDTVSEEELAAREEPMRQVAGNTYLTPAEGPCTPEEEGPLCDRDAVIDEFRTKYGGVAPFIPDALIRRCGGTVDDYDDLFEETKFKSSCDLPAANFGRLYSVLGHMHEFGDAYRMTLNPDTPEELVLLDIPSWSFEWQLYYVPTEEIRIEEGDVIRFECTWDRANLYMPEPRYITWNEGTVDEMCFSSVAVIPDSNDGQPYSLIGE